MFSAIKTYFGHLLEVPDAVSPARYRSLRRIMTILMVTVSVTPLLILTGINHAQYMSTLEREMENPLYAMVRKSQASLELFLGERASTVSLIAHAYSFDDLTNEQTLNRVFLALKSEFQGFVDMGLVDVNGRQVAYVGPYKLKDADYAGQPWLSEAQVKGRYISDVFLGLRGFPHMVIAVHRMEESGREWTLRVTIDTSRLERLVAAVGLMQDTDAFLCDSRGILQTNSRFYGKVLDKLPLTLPPQSFETTVRPWKDDSGQDLMVAYTSLTGADFMLLAVKPTLDIYKPWTALRSELLLVFCGGIAVIVLVSHLLMKHLVGRLQASDERRVAVFAQMEHNQKLSSIGRLAAGVAHEVNNPLAVINEKAGLGLDLLHMSGDLERKDRLINLLEAIESTVERARGITHRLLGFARRMEANRQELSVPEVLTETMGFLERGAKNRGVNIGTDFAEGLPDIVSDRGQLQQVFLNIMGNALDAVPDGGKVDIACTRTDGGGLLVRVTDNGKGMSPEVIKHIFEPFFTTKKTGEGTGLGLALADQIIRTHRGRIRAESTIGRGTTFYVYLPVLEQQQEREQLQWGVDSKLRILAADDNNKVLDLLDKDLSALGLSVSTCSRRGELRQLLEQQPFDVLAIDESLMSSSGVDLCMAIRGRYPGMTRIVMTNAPTREIVDARSHGVIDGYVVKPVSASTLLAQIRSSRKE
mgnify:FL=1